MLAADMRALRTGIMRLQDCAHQDTPAQVLRFFRARARGHAWRAAHNPAGRLQKGPTNLRACRDDWFCPRCRALCFRATGYCTACWDDHQYYVRPDHALYV